MHTYSVKTFLLYFMCKFLSLFSLPFSLQLLTCIFLPLVKCNFRTQVLYLLHLADGELEINNDIPVGAFLIPNSVQLLAHDHMDVLKHYALIKCLGANVMG